MAINIFSNCPALNWFHRSSSKRCNNGSNSVSYCFPYGSMDICMFFFTTCSKSSFMFSLFRVHECLKLQPEGFHPSRGLTKLHWLIVKCLVFERFFPDLER